MNLCDFHLLSYEVGTPIIASSLADTWALQLVLAMKCEQK